MCCPPNPTHACRTLLFTHMFYSTLLNGLFKQLFICLLAFCLEQGPMSLELWYKQLPIVTRSYVTLAFLTTAGCALEVRNGAFTARHYVKNGCVSALFTCTSCLLADYHALQRVFQHEAHIQERGGVALADQLLLLRKPRCGMLCNSRLSCLLGFYGCMILHAG